MKSEKEKNLQFNEDKFKELVLYIAEHTADQFDFGATKMAKVLWKSDFAANALLGEPITGATYQKIDYGPGAKEYKPILDSMIDDNVVAKSYSTIGGYPSTKIVALKKADVSKFSTEEISLIDSVIHLISKLNTHQIKELVYKNMGVKVANLYDEIPYLSELFPSELIPLTENELNWAKQASANFISKSG